VIHFELIMNACIICVTTEETILFVKHKDRGWEFPGGKIDFLKDRFRNTNLIDLLQTATRELHEEVSQQIECVGVPGRILYDPSVYVNTIFFVYYDQPYLDKNVIQLSHDDAIDDINYFKLSDIDMVELSFQIDKELINTILPK